MSTVVPEISLISLQNQSESDLKILKEALNTHGFFTITDHDIDDSLLDDSYTFAKEFFDLPEEIKNQYARPEIGGARGYTPFGKETALGENVADLKEFWHLGPEINTNFDSRIHENIKVDELLDFNIHFNTLFTSLNQLGIKVLESIALVLDLPKNFFEEKVIRGNSTLRLLHYPPIASDENVLRARAHADINLITLLESIALVLDLPKNFFEEKVIRGNSTLRLLHYPPIASDENVLRARAHADINLITLLVGAEEGGLEVQNKDDEWIQIKPNSKSIVCNIGDMMQLITEGNLKSTPHRVVEYSANDSKSRYSMPFFLHPSPEVVLKSVFNENDEGVLAHDFLEERIKAIKLY